MGVIMQAFYWDCPRIEGKEYGWWNHVAENLSALKTAGFSAGAADWGGRLGRL